MTFSNAVRRQLPVTLKLAIPLVLGQLGQMVMILIDMYMVGKLGPQAIGGAGVGSAVYWVFTMFGAGTLYGLDYLVSHAFGSKALKECHYWLCQSVYLALLLAIPMVGMLWWVSAHLSVFHFAPEVAQPAAQFLATLSPSLLPFLIFIAFRQYLQATDSARPGTIVTLVAIVSNILLNWILIFGVAGHVAAMGVAGAGLATTITRTLMAVGLVAYTAHRDRKLGWGLLDGPKAMEWQGLLRIFKLGAPSGLQLTLETGVFSVATSIISQIGVVPAASHTIVLNISAFTYMGPLGVAGATAVLVGQQMGRNRPAEASLAGWTSIGLAAAGMFLSGLALIGFAAPLCRLFTADPDVIALGTTLLALVALYQVADGVQAVGSGALRGLGDTRSAMIANLLGYWGIGLPVGWWLCSRAGMGAVGFWIGLTAGLFAVAGIVLWRWVVLQRISTRGMGMMNLPP